MNGTAQEHCAPVDEAGKPSTLNPFSGKPYLRTEENGKPSTLHPFLEGHRWRTDELGDMTVTSAHWRWTTWTLIVGLILIVSLWAVREITRAEVKVFMVEIDTNGTTRLIAGLPDRYVQKEETVKGHLRDFVRKLRRVIDDKVAMGEDWDKQLGLYGRVTKNGRQQLNEEIAKYGDPLTQPEPVMVEIVRTLAKGKQTFDVTWIERRYSAAYDSRQLLDTTYWSGLFSYTEAAPKTEEEVQANYLGIWWDQWSYSKDR